MKLAALATDRHARQFVKFVLVGLLTTAVNFAVYGLLVLGGLHYLVAAVAAFLFATLNSYTLNRRWTFRAGAHRTERMIKFTAVQLVGLTINLLVLALLVERLGFENHKLLAQLIANGFVVVNNFLGNKLWTFR